MIISMINSNFAKGFYYENKKTGRGNNISIGERIVNHWDFYYNDYDGKVISKK